MATDRRVCAPVRSCRICVHYDQPPADVGGVAVGDCRSRNAAWWPQRGYGPCPHYVERPLSDEDY